jgi:AraC family transcriptional regulator
MTSDNEVRNTLERQRGPPWLTRATAFLQCHYRNGLSMDEVAEVAGVHPAHLAAVFRRVHRVSLGQYVRRLRVTWAAEQLLATDAPIAAVALEAGFSDQAHLTRWFRRETGFTPAAYRRSRGRKGGVQREGGYGRQR